MTLRAFIRTNRPTLEKVIRSRMDKPQTLFELNAPTKLTIEEIRLWILNDEPLYRWAQSEGVRI